MHVYSVSMARVVVRNGALGSVLGSVRTLVRSLGNVENANALSPPFVDRMVEIIVRRVAPPNPLKTFTALLNSPLPTIPTGTEGPQ